MTRILAVQGGSNTSIQALMCASARRWAAGGARIAGIVETRDERARAPCARNRLLDLATGRTFPLHQDLGPGSTACQLDGRGVAEACETVRQQILAGCDLAILSKFGKLEAARSGLIAAFAAAAETGTPILTAVAPAFAAQWTVFSGQLGSIAAPNQDVLDAWWFGLRAAVPRLAGQSRAVMPDRAPALT